MDDYKIAELLIRFGVGIVMVVFGLHQIKSPASWQHYIPGLVRFMMPISSSTFMRLHGSGNVSLGLLLMSGLIQPVSACLALAWWLWVLPFAAYYDWTVGLRDFAIAMALLALVYLV